MHLVLWCLCSDQDFEFYKFQSVFKSQLICTVTPSSSSTEETHNTLKFAHRAKHVEIQAAQNKVLACELSVFLEVLFFAIVETKALTPQIIDEKSLIKKYQNEIRSLKEELEQLKRGIVTLPQLKDAGGDDIVILKQKVHLCYVFDLWLFLSLSVQYFCFLYFWVRISCWIWGPNAYSAIGKFPPA